MTTNDETLLWPGGKEDRHLPKKMSTISREHHCWRTLLVRLPKRPGKRKRELGGRGLATHNPIDLVGRAHTCTTYVQRCPPPPIPQQRSGVDCLLEVHPHTRHAGGTLELSRRIHVFQGKPDRFAKLAFTRLGCSLMFPAHCRLLCLCRLQASHVPPPRHNAYKAGGMALTTRCSSVQMAGG